MTLQTIIDYKTGKTLFTGYFPTLSACVEAAVAEGVDLAYADLSHANLANSMLDEARLAHACLRGANLTGANISEACLDHADLRDTTLYNTCLCYSSLRETALTGAVFGGTDVAGGVLDGITISTPSALLLNFRDSLFLQGGRYIDAAGQAGLFNRPPVTITGQDYTISLLDTHFVISAWLVPYAGFLATCADNRPCRVVPDHNVSVFLHHHRHAVRDMIRAFRRDRMADQSERAA